MSVVYAPQEPLRKVNGRWVPMFDTAKAEQYGQIQYLLPTGSVVLAVEPVSNSLNHLLRNYSDEDYILPVGDPSLIVLTALIAAKHNRGRIRLLRWDKLIDNYIEIGVNI